MNGQFAGKVAVVTGAASGVGLATARLFAAEGAQVVIADIDESGGEETVKLIVEAGGEAAFIRTDVMSEADVTAMVRVAVERYGRLDFGVNNAAGSDPSAVRHPLTEWSEKAFDLTVGICLKGVWLSIKHEIPAMLQTGGGAIVNIASAAGLRGTAGMVAYAVSKAGVINLSATAAVEFARQGIRVNTVTLGTVDTPALTATLETSANPEAHRQFVTQKIPLGRIAQPREAAEAITWLCSEKAAYITGENLIVDGGFLAALY